MSVFSKLSAHIKLLPPFEHTLPIGVAFFQAEIVVNNNDLHTCRCEVTNGRVHLL